MSKSLSLVLTLLLFLCWPQPRPVRAAGGGFDLTFGDGGRVITDISAGGDNIHALAIQPDGKIVAVGFGTGNFALARYNIDGTLDLTFGTGGKVDTRLRNTFTEAFAVAIAPDGNIVVAGQGFGGDSGQDFAIARYNPDGSLDTTFGTGGMTLTDFGGFNEAAMSVVIQPDGKIIAAGSNFVLFGLARYNTDGSLDSRFGSGGKVITDFGGGQSILAVALDAQGRIIAGGRAANPSTLTGNNFALARYRSDGSLDSSFGSGGKVTTDFSGRDDFAFDMIVQPDEKIVLAGTSEGIFERTDFALARYDKNGGLDTRFGSGGKVTTDLFPNIDGPFGSSDSGFAVARQFDGKIVVAGRSITNMASNAAIVLARYDGKGDLDPTFGSGGKLVTTFSGTFEGVQALAIQNDGKILVGGNTSIGDASRGRDFALARYLSSTPRITGVTVSGKKLLVSGEDFGEGAVILINGVEQKTKNDGQNPTTDLIGKKAGKKIKAGDRIQIRNMDRALSPEFIFMA